MDSSELSPRGYLAEGELVDFLERVRACNLYGVVKLDADRSFAFVDGRLVVNTTAADPTVALARDRVAELLQDLAENYAGWYWIGPIMGEPYIHDLPNYHAVALIGQGGRKTSQDPKRSVAAAAIPAAKPLPAETSPDQAEADGASTDGAETPSTEPSNEATVDVESPDADPPVESDVGTDSEGADQQETVEEMRRKWLERKRPGAFEELPAVPAPVTSPNRPPETERRTGEGRRRSDLGSGIEEPTDRRSERTERASSPGAAAGGSRSATRGGAADTEGADAEGATRQGALRRLIRTLVN